MRALLLSCIALLSSHVLVAAFVTGSSDGDIKELYSWVQVEYDWAGSPWANASAAAAAGSFNVENNVITGLGVYGETVFVCVPRWRRGVPSTLNTVVRDASTGRTLLRPWPSWWHNLNVFSYVQSVYVDTTRGLIYVIDAGRQNFFSADASAVVNRAASLHVLEIDTAQRVYYHEFGDDIFPYNSSFLNDIVVDERRGVAYMSDTNTAGHGALVMHNLNTNVSVRYAGNSTLADPNYIVTILGVRYPGMTSPADGIALSDDGERLYYSVVEGDQLHRLDASVFRDPNSTHGDIERTVSLVAVKPSNSDGLRVVPSFEWGVDRVVFGDIGHCSVAYYNVPVFRNVSDPPLLPKRSLHTLLQNNVTMQWLDSFALVPKTGELYFTTNRLQRYFARDLVLNGTEGSNFRLWRWRFHA